MTKLWRTPFDAEAKATAPPRIDIKKDKCKGCGYCSEFCPRDVIQMSIEINVRGYTPAVVENGAKCLGCGLCEIICPEFAIEIISPNGKGLA